jgi:hypothetical protein
MRYPVISPYVNLVSCAYIPAAALIDNPYSMMDASPSVARAQANLRM